MSDYDSNKTEEAGSEYNDFVKNYITVDGENYVRVKFIVEELDKTVKFMDKGVNHE